MTPEAMGSITSKPSAPNNDEQPSVFTHFFDLPPEVRDMVYIRWPRVAWIDITQSHPYTHRADPENDKSINQPTISKVCRRMRREALDVFYGKNKFLLDLRGWKHSDYPKHWTPLEIFRHWIDAIGDENAARLRSLSFLSHNFAVHVRISNESPRISMRFRAQSSKPELAETAPRGYSFELAVQRAQAGLRNQIQQFETLAQGRPFNANDIKGIAMFVDMCQPFLCKRLTLGYQGAVLPETDRMADWPDNFKHLDKCDDCGYHRCTRGED